MSRLTGLALVAALLAVTGCAKDSPNLTAPNTSAKKEPPIFEGSPKAVAAAAQVALEQMNVVVLPSPKTDAVRLVGNVRGNLFALVFERRTSGGVEKTAVHIIWDKGTDEQFWMDFVGTMMTALVSQQRKALAASD